MFFSHCSSVLRHKPLFFSAFLINFALAALCQPAKIDSSNMLTLRLNLQDARGASVSQVFENVNFIPLETTKESLFGNISQLKTLKGHYIIFDYDTRAVLIFSSTGKFRAKIDGRMINEGDTEEKGKTQFYGFEIRPHQEDSIIAINSNKHLHCFNLDGKRVAKILSKDAYTRDMILPGSDAKVRPGYVRKLGNDSTHYEFAILTKTDTLPYFPFDIDRYKKDEFWDGAKFFSYGIPGEMFFVNLHGFNLYKVTPSKLSLAYRIILPASNTLPQDFNTNPIYVKKRGEFFRSNPNVFYRISFAYQIHNNLYMQMSCFASPSEVKKAIIYNLKTTEMTSLQDLQPDSLSHFLPVNDAGHYYDFVNRGFLLLKDDYLYTSYSSLAMFSFKEQLGDTQKTFSPLLDEYFKTQNRKSNPVIVQLKPKKN